MAVRREAKVEQTVQAARACGCATTTACAGGSLTGPGARDGVNVVTTRVDLLMIGRQLEVGLLQDGGDRVAEGCEGAIFWLKLLDERENHVLDRH